MAPKPNPEVRPSAAAALIRMSTLLAVAPSPAPVHPASLGLPPDWTYEPGLEASLPDHLDYRLYKTITGGTGRYAVCVTGDIHVWDIESNRRLKATADKGCKKRKGSGRLRVTLDYGRFIGKKKPYLSRLVCIAAYGRPPNESYEADHIDTDKNNNEWTNLQWVTGDNNRRLDRIRRAPPKKRRSSPQKTGSDNSNSKLDNLEQFLIDATGGDRIYTFKAPMSERDLSDIYGISRAQVHRILTGQSRRAEVEKICIPRYGKSWLPKKFRPKK